MSGNINVDSRLGGLCYICQKRFSKECDSDAIVTDCQWFEFVCAASDNSRKVQNWCVVEPGYEPLADVLREALEQAQHGKGKECHANGLPFTEQPIMQGAREAGAGGLVFQSRKKILEAMNCKDDDRAIEDLLGAINYVATQIILRREVAAGRPGDQA